ncbi:MAG: hypothetical protein ACFFC9_14995, partial [Promethearchaeota archaeon]
MKKKFLYKLLFVTQLFFYYVFIYYVDKEIFKLITYLFYKMDEYSDSEWNWEFYRELVEDVEENK